MEPIDGSWLALYRVGFGACLLWHIWKYFSTDLIRTFYVEPTHHFTWLWLDFVRPWPERGMYLHFSILAVAAACILVGFYYRLAALIFCVGYTWIFLLDQCWYLNHYYLICLLAFLAIFLPANRQWSIDSLRNPQLRRDSVPTWTLWLLRYQVAIPYVFGGIAKLNSDWLYGEPMRTWLAARTDFPVIGQLFTQEWCVLGFVYGGLLLDLFVIPLLLWHRTRPFALLLAICFHLMNARLFQIGVFPWMMIWMTLTLFVPPDTIGLITRRRTSAANSDPPITQAMSPREVGVAALLVVYLCWQTLMPMRHWFYPGNTAFTREGHQFSWRMKLNRRSLYADYTTVDPPTGIQRRLPLFYWLTSLQERKLQDPDQLLQLAQWMEHDIQQAGDADPIITAEVMVRLNGRPLTPFVDPQLDLTAQVRSWRPADWVVQQPVPLLLKDLGKEAPNE